MREKKFTRTGIVQRSTECLSISASLPPVIIRIIIIVSIIIAINMDQVEAVSGHKPSQEDELTLSRGENANVLKKTSDGKYIDMMVMIGG